MGTVKDIYDRMLETPEKKVRIRVPTKKEHDTIRISLCRVNQLYVATDISTYSVCADFDSDTGVSSFWLGEARRKQAKTWEILDDDQG